MSLAHQPNLFFPWLARWVSQGGPFRCISVAPRSDGVLLIDLESGAHRVRVEWSIARAAEGAPPFRDGSLAAMEGDRRLGSIALSQLARRIHELPVPRSLPFIEARNREHEQIALGPHLASALWGDLLQPGKTRYGTFHFAAAAYHEGGSRLHFRSRDSEVVFQLSDAADASAEGELVSTGGPLAVRASGALSHPEAPALTHFIGYLVRIATRDGMRVVAEQQERPSREQEPGTDAAAPDNPFFHDNMVDDVVLVEAFFACCDHIAVVGNVDRECAQYFVYLDGPSPTFDAAPWHIRPSRQYFRGMRYTDLSDIDAVMHGSGERLAHVIRESMHSYRPEILVVMAACVARLIGDDTSEVCDLLRSELAGVRVINFEVTNDLPDNYRWLWRQLLEVCSDTSVQTTPHSINLIGFGHERSTDVRELRAHLDAAGITVNACLIPSFKLEELARFFASEVNVLFPWAFVRSSFEYAAPLCSLPMTTPPAPYGVRGTLSWLSAVAGAAGLEVAEDKLLGGAMDGIRDEWESLRQRAREHRALLVLLENHWLQPEPELRLGVPWIRCLDEMGFGLDLVLYRTAAGRGGEAGLKAFVAGLEHATEHRIHTVATQDELAAALRDSDSRIVYTELARDRRVTSAGKAPFSFAELEMGLPGAVRSLRRLLALCRHPFFRRYGSYLECPEWKV